MNPIPPEVSQERVNEAEQLLSRSIDELYEDLGKELGARGFPEDLVRAGRSRFHAIVTRCHASICGSGVDPFLWMVTGLIAKRSLWCARACYRGHQIRK
jgi:hypothetical protein